MTFAAQTFDREWQRMILYPAVGGLH
jgi:hypothetical protein